MFMIEVAVCSCAELDCIILRGGSNLRGPNIRNTFHYNALCCNTFLLNYSLYTEMNAELKGNEGVFYWQMYWLM